MSEEYARAVLERLDDWANQLAAPLLPPKVVVEGDLIRLVLREHIPHSVMVGKSIRAVSGLRAAVMLAEAGYITECASLLRMVSDFCTEITAIGEALHRGGKVPVAVQTFVDQYFTFKHRTPEALAAAERTRYVAREELMKAEVRMAEGTSIDPEKVRDLKRFLNMGFDSYVHGAYESTMELCDPNRVEFMMRGHRSVEKRAEFIEAAFLKMHEVVIALEMTAALTACEPVFNEARETRRKMDTLDPWPLTSPRSSQTIASRRARWAAHRGDGNARPLSRFVARTTVIRASSSFAASVIGYAAPSVFTAASAADPLASATSASTPRTPAPPRHVHCCTELCQEGTHGPPLSSDPWRTRSTRRAPAGPKVDPIGNGVASAPGVDGCSACTAMAQMMANATAPASSRVTCWCRGRPLSPCAPTRFCRSVRWQSPADHGSLVEHVVHETLAVFVRQLAQFSPRCSASSMMPGCSLSTMRSSVSGPAMRRSTV